MFVITKENYQYNIQFNTKMADKLITTERLLAVIPTLKDMA